MTSQIVKDLHQRGYVFVQFFLVCLLVGSLATAMLEGSTWFFSCKFHIFVHLWNKLTQREILTSLHGGRRSIIFCTKRPWPGCHKHKPQYSGRLKMWHHRKIWSWQIKKSRSPQIILYKIIFWEPLCRISSNLYLVLSAVLLNSNKMQKNLMTDRRHYQTPCRRRWLGQSCSNNSTFKDMHSFVEAAVLLCLCRLRDPAGSLMADALPCCLPVSVQQEYNYLLLIQWNKQWDWIKILKEQAVKKI